MERDFATLCAEIATLREELATLREEREELLDAVSWWRTVYDAATGAPDDPQFPQNRTDRLTEQECSGR
jgi:hypothetical protein